PPVEQCYKPAFSLLHTYRRVVKVPLNEYGYSRAFFPVVAPFRLLRRITLIAAQNEEDGERFVALGAKNNQVTVTGSLKFDISVT
ncbi:hypothetical protein MJM04_32305, partial [Salmonella enterica subsp. enterica serovar Cerro]|nr:hypothetical protein [Salmonella enterica subsp. enterica serovar Cerro]